MSSLSETSECHQPYVSIIITTHNRREKVLRTIASVLASARAGNSLETIVIDDASTDGTSVEVRAAFPKSGVRILRCEQEQLISECRNIGMREARGEYVFFLDDDVIVSRDAPFELVEFLSRSENVACVMPIILYYHKPDVIWCAGIKHNFWTTVGRLLGQNELDIGQFKYPTSTDSVMTAFMVRRSIAAEAKFDSKTFPIGWEDMDFATRIRKSGYDVFVLPCVKVWHDYPGAHFLRSELRLFFEVRNRVIFHKRWSTSIAQYMVSVAFSVAVGLSYIILGIPFGQGFAKRVRTILRALVDGLLFQPSFQCHSVPR